MADFSFMQQPAQPAAYGAVAPSPAFSGHVQQQSQIIDTPGQEQANWQSFIAGINNNGAAPEDRQRAEDEYQKAMQQRLYQMGQAQQQDQNSYNNYQMGGNAVGGGLTNSAQAGLNQNPYLTAIGGLGGLGGFTGYAPNGGWSSPGAWQTPSASFGGPFANTNPFGLSQ